MTMQGFSWETFRSSIGLPVSARCLIAGGFLAVGVCSLSWIRRLQYGRVVRCSVHNRIPSHRRVWLHTYPPTMLILSIDAYLNRYLGVAYLPPTGSL